MMKTLKIQQKGHHGYAPKHNRGGFQVETMKMEEEKYKYMITHNLEKCKCFFQKN